MELKNIRKLKLFKKNKRVNYHLSIAILVFSKYLFSQENHLEEYKHLQLTNLKVKFIKFK